MKIKFFTLGCKVNQYDTQSIRERFLKNGYEEIYNGEPADVCLINTCTVTAIADRKSRSVIRNCIRENPRAMIIVTGCIVEKDAGGLSGIKGIGLIISKKFFPSGVSNFCGHTRAFLKIQDGCNNYCSYCKVPLVRGESRSRAFHEIELEAARLVKNGFKEIVLCGICLGSYGKDLKAGTNLADVIKSMEKIDGLLRIRLSSIEAGDVSLELINKIARSKKMCKHLHIPIQSGDDEILKNMHRNFSRSDYLALIRIIKNRIPGIAITTDVLVGFPGEKEGHFQNTVDLVKKILPARTHIFPYSSRPKTAASFLEDKINPEVIKERLARLVEITKDCSLVYKRSFLNKSVDVLIEAHSKEYKGCWEGYTDNYLKVLVKSRNNLKNQLVKVRLKNINHDCINADLL